MAHPASWSSELPDLTVSARENPSSQCMSIFLCVSIQNNRIRVAQETLEEAKREPNFPAKAITTFQEKRREQTELGVERAVVEQPGGASLGGLNYLQMEFGWLGFTL